ncbi:phage shock protein A [Pseudomonas nitritireducens]|uniref:Phage shock protein A n=1 Tax=Pseudomonas nitroreducens TaxID=46680 RepID=A0A7W7KNK3_PSENT|nr:PspA/IM30 family protein [Pseudomonas nitritireducens]MBB4866095.1 phage shock protein A [Pseudomonas nitritireducens]
MSVWNKLGSLLRGQARESVEWLVDANALRILEQELHDADSALLAARQQLTLLCAERIGLERERAAQQQQLQKREAQARAALAQGEEALALEVAGLVARLETRILEQDRQIGHLGAQEARLKARLKASAQTLQEHRRELVQVRATASAQQASAQIGSHQHQLQGRMAAIQESLGRIRQRQQAFDDQEQAARALLEEESDAPLEQRLQAAGIVASHDAHSVLQRLRSSEASRHEVGDTR